MRGLRFKRVVAVHRFVRIQAEWHFRKPEETEKNAKGDNEDENDEFVFLHIKNYSINARAC